MLTSVAGAHSHIRGLGLDDALEPRQVMLYVYDWFTSDNILVFGFNIAHSVIETKWHNKWWTSLSPGVSGDGGSAGISEGSRADPWNDQRWSNCWSCSPHCWPAWDGQDGYCYGWVFVYIFIMVNHIYDNILQSHCKILYADMWHYNKLWKYTRPVHDWELFIVQVLLSPLALTHLSLLWLGVRFSLWRWARRRLSARPSAKP